MTPVFTKGDDPHRMLTPAERDSMFNAAEELRVRARLVLMAAERFEAARTIGDVLAVDVEFDSRLSELGEQERR